MSDLKDYNKKLAQKTKKILTEIGYPIQLGASYEFLSKMSGYPNWDTASAAKIKLLEGKTDVELSSREKEIEKTFNFKPRTPAKLKEVLQKIIFEFFEEDTEPEFGKEAGVSLFDHAFDGTLEDGPLFELFDSLGVLGDRDPELDYIYNLASNCWFTAPGSERERTPLVELLESTLMYGFNKEDHFKMLEGNADKKV